MITKSSAWRIRASLLTVALLLVAAPVRAQQPSANALALAREIITIKGSADLFNPTVPNIIDQAKGVFLQTNPMLSKDLNEVAAKLKSDLAPRSAELRDNFIKLYATRFTEQELKDVLAFYKTPVGKKIITEEPAVLDEAVTRAREWANKFSEEVIIKIRAEMKKKGHDL